MRDLPFGVREYSTRGGISAYICLLMSCSPSSALSVEASTLGDMSGMARAMALKRVPSFSEITSRMSSDHLPEKRDMMLRTGHCSMQAYFFRFSSSSNRFIFSYSYPAVSGLHQCNLLQGQIFIDIFALSK